MGRQDRGVRRVEIHFFPLDTSFGSQVRVVRPDSLSAKVKEEARKILRL